MSKRKQEIEDYNVAVSLEAFSRSFHLPPSPRRRDHRGKTQRNKDALEKQVEAQLAKAASQIWNYCRERGNSLDAGGATRWIEIRIRGVLAETSDAVEKKELEIAKYKQKVIDCKKAIRKMVVLCRKHKVKIPKLNIP